MLLFIRRTRIAHVITDSKKINRIFSIVRIWHYLTSALSIVAKLSGKKKNWMQEKHAKWHWIIFSVKKVKHFSKEERIYRADGKKSLNVMGTISLNKVIDKQNISAFKFSTKIATNVMAKPPLLYQYKINIEIILNFILISSNSFGYSFSSCNE